MGRFAVDVRLAKLADPGRTQDMKLLVDTGSVYTWVPSTVLSSLGIGPTLRRRVRTIQGEIIERPAAVVLMTLNGETLSPICLFGQPGDLEVLGAVTLEEFGLGGDPVQQRLFPSVQYGA